ncbi:MAG TPA: VOC family protein [Acidimicrobiales bacterium]|nr:VOC family protein [Acidimicrobiales bacterium]
MIHDIDLDHIAVAAERQTDLWPRYAGDLGGVWVAGGEDPGFASSQLRFANGMKLETMHPGAGPRDFLRRFLAHSGPGPHHITFKVADIEAAIAEAERAGYPPVSVDLSMEMWKEAFLHPKQATGVVVQLAQSAGEWASPPPAELPAARGATATLVHVAHAVRRLDDGLRLFRDLLGGTELGRGTGDADDDIAFVDLGWRGPGRVRLLEMPEWLDDREGRVHHVAFAGPGLQSEEVAPEDNFGVRLRLQPS